MQFSDGYLLILVKLSLELSPTVYINSFISIGLEDLNLSIEVNNQSNMVIFTIGHKPLNGALCVSGGHEDNITGFSALQKFFLSHCILFLIEIFLGLH